MKNVFLSRLCRVVLPPLRESFPIAFELQALRSNGLHWSIHQDHGVTSDPLEAVVQALFILQTPPAEQTEKKQ